ncbi:MAG: hypothetical protein QXP97_00815 [Desulfurococcus sp.]|jgi:hypothetical protein|uniref:hypothetical protein n=1 Tax=Desulfurococcus sp. TaxID=51678 RepID=UPI0031658964
MDIRRWIIIAAILLAAITLLPVFTQPYKPGECPQTDYSNISLVLRGLGIQLYVSTSAIPYIDKSSLEALGFSIKVYTAGELTGLNGPSIILLNVSELAGRPIDMFNELTRATRNISKLAIVVLNPYGDEELSKAGLEAVLKYYGSIGLKPLLPLSSPELNDKLQALRVKPEVFKAKALVFSVNPTGFIVVETLEDFEETMLLVVKWMGFMEDAEINNIALYRAAGPASITSLNGFNPVGFVGWITANFTGAVCGEITGYMAVKVDYFYANTTTLGGKLYHAFLAHVEHSAKGYATTCCPWWWPWCSPTYHYPKTFVSKTDWHTTTWPGQVLDDWQPKNAGSASTVTYTIAWNAGASVGQGIRATVSYSTSTSITQPNAPYYTWYDISDPPYGIAASKHELQPGGLSESQLTNILFTVEPSSIGFLDPDRYGDVLPMIIQHQFNTALNTGDAASISFSVSLYPTSLYYW